MQKASVMRDTLSALELKSARAAIALALNDRDVEAAGMARSRDLAIPAPHGRLAARLYRPGGVRAGHPMLLFVHGGGFVHCDLDSHDALCRRLASASGLRILSVDYRLAPEHAFPAQVEDGKAALRWLLDRLKAHGDREKLLVGGDSAGAYIVLSAVAGLDRDDLGRIAGQLLIYPLLQLDDEQWASTVLEDTRVLGRLAVRYIRERLQPGETGIPSLLDASSLRDLPTVIATGGALDPCRPDALAYAAALGERGTGIELLQFRRLMHGFGNYTHVLGPARAAVAEIGRALGELAGKPEP